MAIRILIVVNDAAFFLSHRLPIALGAQAAGFDVHVATPRDEVSNEIATHGLTFHPIPMSRRSIAVPGEVASLAALVRLYRSLRPDLVHHVTMKPIIYGGLAARIARVPAVVHAVSGLGSVFVVNDARARILQRGVRVGYRIATAHPNCAVIFQNDDDRAALGNATMSQRTVMIAGSGVDLDRFVSTPVPQSDSPIVLLPGRMLWDKGVGEFVEAARELKKRGTNARFVLSGGIDAGHSTAVGREQLEAWAREGAVEWWGTGPTCRRCCSKPRSFACHPIVRECPKRSSRRAW